MNNDFWVTLEEMCSNFSHRTSAFEFEIIGIYIEFEL